MAGLFEVAGSKCLNGRRFCSSGWSFCLNGAEFWVFNAKTPRRPRAQRRRPGVNLRNGVRIVSDFKDQFDERVRSTSVVALRRFSAGRSIFAFQREAVFSQTGTG